MTTSRSGKQIRAVLSVHEVHLGESIPLEVIYANQGSQPLSFRDPARTWEVMLSVVEPGGETKQMSFGRMFHTQVGELSRVTIEDAEQIALAPGGAHRFTEDLWARWPELWQPGRAMLQVIDQSDDAETLRSNALALDVTFSAASVPIMLALARSSTADERARRVAADWLGRLHPFGPATDAPVDSQIADARALDMWEHWWTQMRYKPEVAAAFASINHRRTP